MTNCCTQIKWKFFLLCLFCSSYSFVSAQVERQIANHWFFGNQYGLDFSNGTAQVNNNSAMFTFESSLTMSNKAGDLLFYTNGGGRVDSTVLGYVWNANHEIMEGGEIGAFDGGGYSSAQGVLSFLKPGTEDQYYLFTIDELETINNEDNPFDEGKGLSYFEIDMTADGGLGAVTVNNEKLLVPAFEHMSATKHDNCNDYWLLARTGYGFITQDPTTRDSFYLFKITETGIEDPIVTPLPDELSFTTFGTGAIRFAPDGAHFTCGVHLFDFDKNNGAIGNYIDLENGIGVEPQFPLAFSSNGEYLLYFTVINESEPTETPLVKFFALQYEIATSTVYSVSEISYPDEDSQPISTLVGTPQLAPDGKMYIPFHHGFFNEPTRIYVVEQPNVLGFGAGFHGPVLELSPLENEAFLTFGNFTDHIFYVNPNETIPLDLPDEFIVDCQEVEPIIVTSPLILDCMLWSTGDTSAVVEIEEEGIYWLEVAEGCDIGRDSFEVIYENNLFEIDLGNDTMICEGEEVFLSATFVENANYLWNDSTDVPVVFADEAGVYWVEITLENCYERDSFVLDILEFPVVNIGEDTLICEESELMLDASGPNNWTFEWQDGSSEETFLTDGLGFYGVMVTNDCGTDSDEVFVNIFDCEVCNLQFPNVFSPNQDGVSDTFNALSDCTFSAFNLKIFNRWGNIVFEGNDLSAGWDGAYNGQESPSDAYFYILDFETENPLGVKEKGMEKGEFTLIR